MSAENKGDRDIILSVRNVSKCFEMYEKPAHRLYQTLCAGRKKFYKEFWALRDVSFDVRRGECVGIIGRNGAGKSTLLQVITGTLAPTAGDVEVRGRIAALLELGSGFNPEFTGRENVYLNASILGLTKREIDARYDEIVAFADIGDFIDRPVKTYSSGMMVRLAFAVQVLVEPDILIVDEALSVGDTAFQRKCYIRMSQLVEKGCTLLLVSHDTNSIKRMCTSCVFLKNGRVMQIGDAATAVNAYLRDVLGEGVAEHEDDAASAVRPVASDADGACLRWRPDDSCGKNSFGSGGGRINEIRAYGLNHANVLPIKGKLRIEVDAEWDRDAALRLVESSALENNVFIGYAIANDRDVRLFGSTSCRSGCKVNPDTCQAATVAFDILCPELRAGDYFLVVALSAGDPKHYEHIVWHDFTMKFTSQSPMTGGLINPDTDVSVSVRR